MNSDNTLFYILKVSYLLLMNFNSQIIYKNDDMKPSNKLTFIHLPVQILTVLTFNLLKHQKEKKKKQMKNNKLTFQNKFNMIHLHLTNMFLINHIKNILKMTMNHGTNPTLTHQSFILKANMKLHSKNKFLLLFLMNLQLKQKNIPALQILSKLILNIKAFTFTNT